MNELLSYVFSLREGDRLWKAWPRVYGLIAAGFGVSMITEPTSARTSLTYREPRGNRQGSYTVLRL
jgi:hypothetical protein